MIYNQDVLIDRLRLYDFHYYNFLKDTMGYTYKTIA